ncbi:unnamed protein product [Polarella glacialis]|uniref:MYND-type domain-containing protein n=1 Tax=Polarella glacialis TaxID=89957 RepID=A0A813HMM6_POLGL|nr:unnamed protein product [Polarella glacialis]CAE8739843.1 unnamed protein product [Polarella glacialis]
MASLSIAGAPSAGPKSRSQVCVFVSALSGEDLRPRPFRVRPGDSIRDFKWILRAHGVRCHPGEMQLVLGSELLPDDWAFGAQSVRLVLVRMPRGCASCAAQQDDLRICAGCKAVRYCSQECQRHHWREQHRAECRQFQQPQGRVEVLCLDGASFQITASVAMTVRSIKIKLSELMGRSLCYQRPTLTTLESCEALEDDMRLAELGDFGPQQLLRLVAFPKISGRCAVLLDIYGLGLPASVHASQPCFGRHIERRGRTRSSKSAPPTSRRRSFRLLWMPLLPWALDVVRTNEDSDPITIREPIVVL